LSRSGFSTREKKTSRTVSSEILGSNVVRMKLLKARNEISGNGVVDPAADTQGRHASQTRSQSKGDIVFK
jgi:hypothetical protein